MLDLCWTPSLLSGYLPFLLLIQLGEVYNSYSRSSKVILRLVIVLVVIVAATVVVVVRWLEQAGIFGFCFFWCEWKTVACDFITMTMKGRNRSIQLIYYPSENCGCPSIKGTHHWWQTLIRFHWILSICAPMHSCVLSVGTWIHMFVWWLVAHAEFTCNAMDLSLSFSLSQL